MTKDTIVSILVHLSTQDWPQSPIYSLFPPSHVQESGSDSGQIPTGTLIVYLGPNTFVFNNDNVSGDWEAEKRLFAGDNM